MRKKTSDDSLDAEIAIARFAVAHNMSLYKAVPHLVKLMKRSFPDSKICQGMGALSASRIAYGITEGLGRTELESTVKDISKNPFSLQLKGGKHRENFLGRYYDEKTEKCVDKFTMAKSVNVENSSVIADIFLGWSKENKINLKEDLVMMNTDHASTLKIFFPSLES